MIALLLCAIAFAATFLAGRRSLVAGLGATLTVGYLYGILRANVPTTFSHFIFDSALVGLFATQLFRPADLAERIRTHALRMWLFLLIGWPVILLVIPIQDPLVQLVGFRAHVFFLPFFLLGARLTGEDLYRLALVAVGLNVMAFGFALGEFVFGLQSFYPRNDVTEIIYRSHDVRVAGSILGLFRIPATFTNAATYGSAMVMTLPLIFLGWLRARNVAHRTLFMTGLLVTTLGVFFSATRTNILLLGVLVIASVLLGGTGVLGQLSLMLSIGAAGWVISTNERLFARVLSLNPDTVIERFTWSMNEGVLDRMLSYPLGNGLGGGGTSMPYFLIDLIRNPIWVENQYATIMLEQGLPGLLNWLGFLAWALWQSPPTPDRKLRVARRMAWLACAAFYATGMIGQGIFTAIPTTPLLFLLTGWMVTPEPEPARAAPADRTPSVPAHVPA